MMNSGHISTNAEASMRHTNALHVRTENHSEMQDRIAFETFMFSTKTSIRINHRTYKVVYKKPGLSHFCA
jgi:hypothetical protein